MDAISQHQTQASHHLALSEAEARAGNFVRSAVELERALAYAATAANSHWGLFPRPTRRQLGHSFFLLAERRYISYTSARWPYKFNALHLAIARTQFTGNRAAARRALRNSQRRAARIINSVNRAIADDPNPTPIIPYP